MKKAQKEEALRTFEIPEEFKLVYKTFENYLKNQAYPTYQSKVADKKNFDDMRDFFIERCRACMKYYDEISHYGYLDTSQLTHAENFFLGLYFKDATAAHMQYSSMSTNQSLTFRQISFQAREPPARNKRIRHWVYPLL
jgi:hypothetical protein